MDLKPMTEEINTTKRASPGTRSSIFRRARFSFVRSGGVRGASVEVLRGSHGSDFESRARVVRGRGYSFGTCFGLFSCGDEGVERRESKKERFLLLKGSALFVFAVENDVTPKYAVKLEYMKAVSSEDTKTVLLETTLGDIEYKFTFPDDETATKFSSAVSRAASVAETNIVKKRLGHREHRTTSVMYAEEIASNKVKDQPQAPIGAEEVLAGMPVSGIAGL